MRCRLSNSPIRTLLWLSVIVACWLGSFDCFESTRSVQAQIYKGSKSVVPSPGSPTNRFAGQQMKNYFTIIGEVKYPETYELPTSAPSLIGFIKLAGGMQPSASGQLRIVRFSRSGQKAEQQLFYDERRTDTLQPGDVVVVDSKVGNARLFNGPDQSASEGDVSIALIGILEYPFVMQTSGKNASINWITQQLHQSDEVAQSAKVCLPGRSGTKVTPDTPLPHNTLIHFESSKVVFSQLPDGLPRPFRPGYEQRQEVMTQLTPPPAASKPPIGIAAPNGGPHAAIPPRRPAAVVEESTGPGTSVALDPERVDPPAGRVRLSDPSLSSKSASAEPKRLQPPANANAVDATSPDPSKEFRKPFQSEVEALDPADRGRAAVDSKTEELPLSPIKDEDIAKTGPSLSSQGASSLPKPAAPNAVAATTTDSSTPSSDDLNKTFEVVTDSDDGTEAASLNFRTIVAIAIGGIGSFAFVWVLLGMLKPQQSQQMIFAQPQQARPLLDRLVNNELEIRVEEARLDPAVRIHGRPRDIGQQRLDAEHLPVRRPHMLDRKQTQTGYSTSAVRTERQPQPASADRLERVAAAERRIAERPRARLAPRPIADAASDPATEAPAATTENQSSASRPKFRVDAIRKPDVDAAPSAAKPNLTVTTDPQPERLSVKPSRVIAEGSDIVDRALAAVGNGK